MKSFHQLKLTTKKYSVNFVIIKSLGINNTKLKVQETDPNFGSVFIIWSFIIFLSLL